MTERKNIKRNKTRLKIKDRPFYSSIQRNYNKKKIVEEKTIKLF